MEYPLHQLIQLGRLEIHITFPLISNPDIDVSWSGSKKGNCQWSLYDFFLRAAFVLGLFPVGGDFPSPVNKKKYWDGGKHEVIHHRRKIMFLQINCFKISLMQICTLKIKIVSRGLVLLARHQGIVIIVSSVIIFVAGVITIFCRKSNPHLFSLHTKGWHPEFFPKIFM